MGSVHAKRVADANLQTIRLADLYKRFGSPGDTIDRGASIIF